MSFASPLFLWGLLLVPATVGAYLLVQRRQTRYAVRFTNLAVLADIAPSAGRVRRYVAPGLFLLALAALVIGLARPNAVVLVPREQATVVLALDSSESMTTPDVPPSRMGAAKNAAVDFVRQLPAKFQIGIVSFSDRAQVQTHPTTDRTAVLEGIKSLEPDGATAIGDAIIRSLRLAPDAPPLERSIDAPEASEAGHPLAAILLLSDGANTAGRVQPLAAAERVAAAGYPVYTIALGPPEGSAELRNSLGQEPDHYTLRAIAETTDGRYFSAPGRQDLRTIYDGLASRLGFVKEHQEVTFAFAGAGVVLASAALLMAALGRGRLP